MKLAKGSALSSEKHAEQFLAALVTFELWNGNKTIVHNRFCRGAQSTVIVCNKLHR